MGDEESVCCYSTRGRNLDKLSRNCWNVEDSGSVALPIYWQQRLCLQIICMMSVKKKSAILIL